MSHIFSISWKHVQPWSTAASSPPESHGFPAPAIPQSGEMLISWLPGRVAFSSQYGRIHREASFCNVRNHSDPLHLVPFEATWAHLVLYYYVSCPLPSHASPSHWFSGFCRRFFHLLLAFLQSLVSPTSPITFSPVAFFFFKLFKLLIEIPFSTMNQLSLYC